MLEQYDVHNSMPFNCRLQSTDEDFMKLSNEIWEDLSINKTVKKDLKKRCLDATLLNMKYAQKTSNYIRVHKKKCYYSEYPKKYKYPFFTFSIMTGIINNLVKLNYLDQLLGFKNPTDGSGLSTKLKPTDKLIEKFVSVNQNVFEEEQPMELIVLKDRQDKTRMDYKDTQNTLRMRQELVEYNKVRQSALIDIQGADKVEKSDKVIDYLNKFALTDNLNSETIKLRNTYIYRVFNGSWSNGGRFYGGVESHMPKALRKNIFIDGEPTVEIDFCSMHVRMLYHKAGIDYQQDAYGVISGNNKNLRKLYKLIGLISINAKSERVLYNSVRNKLIDNNFMNFSNLKNETLRPFVEKWFTTHKLIGKYFLTDQGIKLQNIDSKIAAAVIKHFTKKGIVVLVVHDSFIIQEKYASELKEVMNKIYEDNLGFSPVLK